MKRTATSKRLRRRAGAYKRLAWKRGLGDSQRRHYIALADQLDRQAEREEQRQ